jgi:CheY-like chemotaxis protein
VVEDEPLLAMDIAGHLEGAGASVVGPAGSAREALAIIEQYRLDAALLDANLQGAPVDEIAAALSGAGIPFAFVSGYDRTSLPGPFADAALLPKPFSVKQLMDTAARLVSGAA